MTPKEKKIAMDVRVKQMEIALLGVARAADRECSDISLAMGHDSGRGWDPDAHLQPIVDAIRAALRERDARIVEALKVALDHLVPHGTSAGRMDLYGRHREGCASDYKEIACACGLIQSKAHFHIALTALRALLEEAGK